MRLTKMEKTTLDNLANASYISFRDMLHRSKAALSNPPQSKRNSKAILIGNSKVNGNTEFEVTFSKATREYIKVIKDLEGNVFDPCKLLDPDKPATCKNIIIKGSRPLAGEVCISGAKNSAVALIPAAILADSPVTLDNVPDIQDVHSLIEILEEMGTKATFNNNTLVIDPTNLVPIPMPKGKINKLRASYYFMGSLLGKFGKGVVGLPGGCYLGPRPIDLHIKGFEALGATVANKHGAMYFHTENDLKGTRIFLDQVSIGATINIMLAAVKAKGETIIENAAREPEIIDVATLLKNMGANIHGAGTDVIRINGVDRLQGCSHTIIPDRIEAGTYLALAAAMGKGITIKNVIYEHLASFIAKLKEIGVKMTIEEDKIEVHPSADLKMTTIETGPYPAFATDLQQPITALLLKAKGTGKVIDGIYAQRTKHIPELIRMGADASMEGNTIVLSGPANLHGAEVVASDLRAGACLVIAGLMAKGTTTIYNVEYILRGYDHIIEKLSALGADVQMVETATELPQSHLIEVAR